MADDDNGSLRLLFFTARHQDDDPSVYQYDCHDPDSMHLKTFVISIKKYLYPATIEFR